MSTSRHSYQFRQSGSESPMGGVVSISPIRGPSASLGRSSTPPQDSHNQTHRYEDPGSSSSSSRQVDLGSSGRPLPSAYGSVTRRVSTSYEDGPSLRRGSPGYAVRQNPPQPGSGHSSQSHTHSQSQPPLPFGAAGPDPIFHGGALPSSPVRWGRDVEDDPGGPPVRRHAGPPAPTTRPMTMPPPVAPNASALPRVSGIDWPRTTGGGSRPITHGNSPSPEGGFSAHANTTTGFHQHCARVQQQQEQQSLAAKEKLRKGNWKYLNRFVSLTLDGPSSWKHQGPEKYFDFNH